MKSLVEVITVMDHVEFCCTNCKLQFDCDEVECFLADALHYLKDYRDAQERLDAEYDKYQNAVKNCEEAENKYRQLAQKLGEVGNPPLSWGELRKMEGKPVWVEIGGKGAWDIVWRTGKIYEGEDPDTWMWFYVGHKLPKTTYDSNGWQAYRKEKS